MLTSFFKFGTAPLNLISLRWNFKSYECIDQFRIWCFFFQMTERVLYPSLKNKNPGRKLVILMLEENEENIEESRKATNRFFRRLLLWPKDQRCTSTVFRETGYFWRTRRWRDQRKQISCWFRSKTGWIFRRTLKRQRSLKSKQKII